MKLLEFHNKISFLVHKLKKFIKKIFAYKSQSMQLYIYFSLLALILYITVGSNTT